MKKGLKRLFLWLNIVFILMLLLAYIAPYVDPMRFVGLSFLGLAYPILVLVNVFFAIVWMLRANWRFLYSFIAIILGFSLLGKIIQFSSDLPSDGSLKVISFNCRLLGYYDENEYSDSFINYINESKADVICLQEFYNYQVDEEYVLQKIKRESNFKYVHFQAKVDDENRRQLGLLFLSNYPIEGRGLIPFEDVTSNMVMFADVNVRDTMVRIYNAHLQSIRLSRKDHEFLENPDQQEVVDASKNVVRRVNKAYKIRSKQVKELKEHMNKSELPILLCGDFNDPPCSYSYSTLSEGMDDSFEEAGIGMESTYLGKFPFLRIDYILHDSKFKTTAYRSNKKFASDHKMIEAELILN
jgi:endonuclease/exonuclease/phosphatase family metal-dependent hydrolase